MSVIIINGKVFSGCGECFFSRKDGNYCFWKDETVDPKSIPLDCPYIQEELKKERGEE